MNRVAISGVLGPDLTHDARAGIPVLTFSVTADSRGCLEQTPCVAYGSLAREIAAQYVCGATAEIEGYLEEYEVQRRIEQPGGRETTITMRPQRAVAQSFDIVADPGFASGDSFAAPDALSLDRFLQEPPSEYE